VTVASLRSKCRSNVRKRLAGIWAFFSTSILARALFNHCSDYQVQVIQTYSKVPFLIVFCVKRHSRTPASAPHYDSCASCYMYLMLCTLCQLYFMLVIWKYFIFSSTSKFIKVNFILRKHLMCLFNSIQFMFFKVAYVTVTARSTERVHKIKRDEEMIIGIDKFLVMGGRSTTTVPM